MTVHHDTHISAHSHTHGVLDPLALPIALAAFSLFSYFLCLALAAVFPSMAETMKVLYPAIFPGFVWLTAASIVWGAVFLSIAALYVGCGFALVYNFVCRFVHV